jgi:hypothetical protein
MNPENNRPTPAMNSDYLNQIAPKPPRKSLIPKNKPLLVGILAIVAVVVVVILGVVSSIASGTIGDNERLAARLVATQAIVDSATPNIESSQLRDLNSSLSLYLTNTIRDITPILAKYNVNINNLSKNVTNAESDTQVLTTLENARLNGNYDLIYATEMSNQLDNTIILMQKIYADTNSSSLKTFLSSAYQSLEPTQKQFADFNAADG